MKQVSVPKQAQSTSVHASKRVKNKTSLMSVPGRKSIDLRVATQRFISLGHRNLNLKITFTRCLVGPCFRQTFGKREIRRILAIIPLPSSHPKQQSCLREQ